MNTDLDRLEYLVRELLQDLPVKRDWLNPVLERQLRERTIEKTDVQVGDWVQTITGIGFVENVDVRKANGRHFEVSTGDAYIGWYTRQEITEVRRRAWRA